MLKKTITLILILSCFPRISRSDDQLLKTTSTAILQTGIGKETIRKISNFATKNIPLDTSIIISSFQVFALGSIFYKSHGTELKIEPTRQKATLSISSDF